MLTHSDAHYQLVQAPAIRCIVHCIGHLVAKRTLTQQSLELKNAKTKKIVWATTLLELHLHFFFYD